MAAMLAEAQALAESAATELGSTPALLFCGDLNSDLNDGMPGETNSLISSQMHTDMWLMHRKQYEFHMQPPYRAV